MWARSGDGWTGGDGATSVGLPDGRTLWLFGDSFLGTVTPYGSRSTDTPMVRDAAVVQAGATLSTLLGAGGTSLFDTGVTDEWYWPAAATVEGGAVRVFLWRYAKAGDGPWGFQYTSTWIATLSLPDLAVTGIVPLEMRGLPVAWGTTTMDDGPWTYIYGVEDHQSTKYALVARARRDDLLGAWEFFTGTGWSTDPWASSRIFDQVSSLFTVLRTQQGYALVSSEGMFGRRIFSWWAPTPTGPWLDRSTLYTTPQSGRRTFTYNAVAHPELRGDRLLISYSVNSFDPWDVYANAANYRPRFIRVPLSCLSVR
jgi:hypothetical protein